MSRAAFAFACILILTATATLAAQEHAHQSREHLGTVHFATSCNVSAQKEFDRAVALLHSFEFSRAIAGFNAALKSDDTCAIAYWGIALSQWSNPFAVGIKDTGQLQEGRASVDHGNTIGAKTERERAYLAAVAALYKNFETTSQPARLLAYRDAMAELASKYPADDEAQIFYALSMSASEDPADKTYVGRLKAGAILEKLFAQQPDHPGLAHYIIHTYDVPPLAPRALLAARRYSQIAPDAPHALHMPSHTFTRTGDWQDSIDSNVAAASSAKRDGEVAEELHASDYEVYAYLQTAQDKAAERILASLPEIASRFDPNVVVGGAASPAVAYFALAAIPARVSLERGDWKQASQLTVKETPFPQTDAITWFARGLGAARLGQVKAANESASSLKQIHEQLLKSGETYWALQVEIAETEVRAWTTWAEGDHQHALHQLQSAADLEDATEKSAITPGPLAPAREQLAEMFLLANRPADALTQFQSTLKKEPARFRSLSGAAQSAKQSGHPGLSRRYYLQLQKSCPHADHPARPELREAAQSLAVKSVLR
ncbi:MAG TPA: hypothetical protein VGJ06_18020 [Candidatus Acidoferrum sp.]